MKTNDHDHAKCITTRKFNKLTADNLEVKLAQASSTIQMILLIM